MPTITVEDQLTNPVPNAAVTVEEPYGDVVACGKTDAAGTFTISDLDVDVDGDYVIRSTKLRYSTSYDAVDAATFNGAGHTASITSLEADLAAAEATLITIGFSLAAFIEELGLDTPAASLLVVDNHSGNSFQVVLDEYHPYLDYHFKPTARLDVYAISNFWRRTVILDPSYDGQNFLSLPPVIS